MASNNGANENRAKPFLAQLAAMGDYGINLTDLVHRTGKGEHAVKSVMGWVVKNGLATKHATLNHWFITEEEIVNNETRRVIGTSTLNSGGLSYAPVDPKTWEEKPTKEMTPDQLYHQMVLGMALYVAGIAMEKMK